MTQSLIPASLLQKSDKILFVAHLALGDFTYLQNCFRALAQAYPHLKIHLWVDEVRRTRRKADWEHLKKYSLYDWLAEVRYFDKVYDQTWSPALYRQSIREAQAQRYPIVVSLAVLRRHLYAKLAREISPEGFVVGQKKRVRLLDIRKHLIYRRLDAHIPAYSADTQREQHISEIYAGWFSQLFGIQITAAERFPFVDIPSRWISYARTQFVDWGWQPDRERRLAERVIFLNAYSKSADRSWPLERVIELGHALRRNSVWKDARFIINVVPERLSEAREMFARQPLEYAHLFSADENFFQLPAILALCDLVISVETAVMHLANAVHVPVIALMRQKNPEWAPIDRANSRIITVSGRNDWIAALTVEQVLPEIEASLAPS